MRLTSLAIKGFKSFANETIMHFNENVIGIVGPNGSGKSNVVDAIRWVLGEQKNKELRLEKMQDIIFNGTKKKKEANTASVTLTFENSKNILSSEYNTVSVSRILYRSGESEYKLNDVTCRLKDVRSLFLDTGIGPDSYAIIALGMVDDILADKENARRKMFEQAAGISKYKERKKQTLNKLALTNADLDRIEDILFELNNNLKQLERQAKRTQKFIDLKDLYKKLSIQNALLSVSALKEEYKQLDKEHNTQLDAYRLNESNILTKEALLEAEKNKHLDKEINLSERQKELNKLVNELRDLEENKNLTAQKIDFRNNNKQTLSNSLILLENSVGKLEADLKLINERLINENKTNDNLKSQLESEKSYYDEVKIKFQTFKHNYDSAVKIRQEKEQKQYAYEKQIALLNNSLDNFESETKRILSNIESRKEESSETLLIIEDLQLQLSNKQTEIAIAEEKETNRQDKIAALDTEINSQKDLLIRHNRNLDAKQNEFDLLKSMINNFEGFPESIKYLNKNWRSDSTLLSDILDVIEDYKTCIEQYLENYLNYYIVENFQEAKKAIDLLIQSQNGKAHFFILDQVKSINKTDPISGMITAIDVLKVEPKYQSLINQLLNNVYIIDEVVDEFYVRELPRKVTLLSKSGTHLKTDLTLSGGSVGLFDGKKIGRKKNLEKLEKSIVNVKKEVEALKMQLTTLEVEKNHIKSIQNINTKTLIQEKNRIEQELIKFKTIQESIKENTSKDQSKLEEIYTQQSTINLELEKIKKIYDELKASLASKDNNQTITDDSLQAINIEMSEASDKYNQSNIAVIRQQNLIENLDKEVKYTKNRIDELFHKAILDKKQIARTNEELTYLGKELQKFNIRLESGYQEKKNLESNLNDAEQSFYAARSGIVKIEEELKLINRLQNQLQLKIQDIKEKHTDVKFKISGVSERLKIEFGLSINEIINQEPDNDIDSTELEVKVEKLKIKLSNFGEINPLAVQTFNEMKERHDTIAKQRQDIIEAKDSLDKTIKEIEDSATKQFLSAFERVRSHFIDVFRSLFTADDNCDLILIDPDNPLESNIDIIAKPKGKRPKSLSQLSGGEKTLTATALLFALYLLKPAPFCIFDEVDAPLDDANVRKFNKIIKKFSEQSQFIIVTHNKATMAEVDILYGVYMQDMGISEVTPVDFRSIKHQDYSESLN